MRTNNDSPRGTAGLSRRSRRTAATAALLGLLIVAAPALAAPGGAVSLVETAAAADRDGVLALLVAGHRADERGASGTTALHWAAHHGDAEMVERLLAAGADPRATNDYGATPLTEAAVIADPSTLDHLLRAGADPESANAEGQTALMVVARTGRVDAARLLLRRGAKVDAREAWGGQTALMWAAAQGQAEMIRLLVRAGAAVNDRALVREWPRRVTAEGRPKDMNRGGLTPLLYAAREGCIGCARELLRAGADIDLADPNGVTPLILALINVHWDFAKFLIEAGADVNQWDFYGQSPLYAAVDMNTLPKTVRIEIPSPDATEGLAVIRLLLDKGANPNAQLKLRIPHRQVPYDRYTEPLLNIGATPLLRAAKAGDVAVVKLLLEHGAIADLPNMNGDTPLMAAVGKGWINAPTRGYAYTEDEALQVYALLRAAGADVNHHTNFDESALHSAALRGWNRIVRRLVADGAMVDAADRNGLTPLDFAMGRIPKEFNALRAEARTDTAALLRELGAKRENPALPEWPPAGTPKILARVPGDDTLLPPF